MQEPRTSISALKRRLGLIFLAAAAVILGTALLYYHSYSKAMVREKSDLLSSIAHDKINQILAWRVEKTSRVHSLVDSPILGIYLERYADHRGDKETADLLRRRLLSFVNTSNYMGAFLAEGSGRVLLGAGKFPAVACPEAKRLIKSASERKEAVMGDLHRDAAGNPGLHVAELAARPASGRELFLVASISPIDYLFPVVESWPTASATAETMLARTEGEDVLFLNDLRHKKNTALNFRLPLSTPDLPAAAAAKGITGIMRGTDYNGRRVLAYTSPIPGTPWAMVAKVDEDEIFAPLGTVSALLLLAVLGMLSAAAAGTFLIFRLQAESYSRVIEKTDAALRASERELKEAQRLARLGNWALDLKRNDLRWSDEIYRIFEMDPAKFGASYEAFLDAIHPDDREAVNKAYTDSLKNRTPYGITHRLLMKDGRVKYVSECCETSYDGSGRPLLSRGTVQDITELKLAELRMEKLNKDLAEKNREMENFLYITTHDLRSPLVNIQGFSRNLLDYVREFRRAFDNPAGPAPEDNARLRELAAGKFPEALDFVLSSSRKMDTLITALLKVSRAGRVEVRPERIEMGGLLKQVLDGMRFQLKEAGAEVRTGTLPPCKADPASVTQIFSNLLDNAVKYADKSRRPEIEVSGEIRAGMAVYRVADNGPGIPESELDRIWNVFYRHEHGAQKHGEGIGLPMVRRLAQKNGGAVRVESKEGRGSVFYVELPAAGEG